MIMSFTTRHSEEDQSLPNIFNLGLESYAVLFTDGVDGSAQEAHKDSAGHEPAYLFTATNQIRKPLQ